LAFFKAMQAFQKAVGGAAKTSLERPARSFARGSEKNSAKNSYFRSISYQKAFIFTIFL